MIGGTPMSFPRPPKKRVLTLHDWEAKHYVLAAVIILVVMGLFAYSWALISSPILLNMQAVRP